METKTLLLFVLLLLCAVGMAIFGALLLRARESRRSAELAIGAQAVQLSALRETERSLNENLQKLRQVLEAQRDASARRAEQAAAEIDSWRRRYSRISHWEPVEDIASTERELRQSIAALERLAEALRNTIDGYGSRYVVPPQSALDELASEMAHSEPAQELKRAREASRALVREGRAATCEYSDGSRAELAANFALDAFHGKVEAIQNSVKADNVGTLRQKLRDAFVLVNQQGAAFRNARITDEYLELRLRELDLAALIHRIRQNEREEQRALKERMREEAKVQREIERAQREARRREEALQKERRMLEEERERTVREERGRFEAKLREELARATESERATLEARFRQQLAAQEAVQRAEYEARLADQDAKLAQIMADRERAKSMAQQTKRGTVYIISNIGAFGERVFKIGQTRRLDPMDRIWELGDASVPFDFDVHALIQSDDAPRLEGVLHRHFVLEQVNKMNWRKEFFRVDLAAIRAAVEQLGLQAEWTMVAAAQQFRETQALERQFESDSEFRERWIAEQRGIDFEARTESLVDATEDAADPGDE